MQIVSIVLSVIAVIAALTATVLAYIYVMPEKRREGLKPLMQKVHDFFNFKRLFIEDIMKAVYLFLNILCVAMGAANVLLMLISVFVNISSVGMYFLKVIELVIIAPIALRVGYELIMMTILLVKNVIEINQKLKDQNK